MSLQKTKSSGNGDGTTHATPTSDPHAQHVFKPSGLGSALAWSGASTHPDRRLQCDLWRPQLWQSPNEPHELGRRVMLVAVNVPSSQRVVLEERLIDWLCNSRHGSISSTIVQYLATKICLRRRTESSSSGALGRRSIRYRRSMMGRSKSGLALYS